MLESAVINLASFDIAEDNRRVLTQAYPLLLNDERPEQFTGCIFWESDVVLSFTETIIPEAFDKNLKDQAAYQFCGA